ncbi:e9imm peptide [Streptomyces sp900116325]|uniref:e9imm peptide n=1 Tax=Streptomyces sp. 900116325 TaxID=3154295 RepID=UPI0033DB6CE4
MARDEAIPLVQRLRDVDTADAAEVAAILETLERGLMCPHISDFIYWSPDPELSAEEVVDRALAYKPIAL